MPYVNNIRLDYLLLLALALLVRLLAAWPQQQPNYMDAAYSYVNAVNLAQGRGFVEDFVWNYLDDPAPPPRPSHLYWMPLTSLLAWLGMLIGGVSYRAAQVPFIIVSAWLAPISYGTTFALTGQRRLSWLAGLLAIFSGFYFPFWTAIDNFTPFAVAGSLALLAAWRGLETQNPKSETRSLLWFFGAGLWVGLAHLARADGPLLLIAIILTYLIRLYHASPTTSHLLRPMSYALRAMFCLTSGYLLLMSPWFIRNWLATGAFLPVAGSQTMWLTHYNDLFSYGRRLSVQTFLAQGVGSIIQGRWWVLQTNLQTALAVWGMIFLTPLALAGGWRLRRHGLIQLAGLYALLLFTAMTLVFAFPGALGGLFHSGAALLPFVDAAAVVGLDVAVDWVAARRRTWRAAVAKQLFGLALVIAAMALTGFVYYGRVIKNNTWNQADQLYPVIAAWAAREKPAAMVMINNPPAYRYHGGGLSLVIPNEDIEVTLQAARRYQVDYLVLERNHPAPLSQIYTRTFTHPGLALTQTFTDAAGQVVYIFEIVDE